MWFACSGHFLDCKFNDILKFNDICPSGSLVARTVYSSLHPVSILKEKKSNMLHTTSCVNTRGSSSLTLSSDNPKNLQTQPKTSLWRLSQKLLVALLCVTVLMDWKHLLLSNLETPVCKAKLIKRL